jgi:membrane-associated protease RseP (regulator of RpoE activity)
MENSLVYSVFFLFLFFAIRLGDPFGFALTILGFFVMMYIMEKEDENSNDKGMAQYIYYW